MPRRICCAAKGFNTLPTLDTQGHSESYVAKVACETPGDGPIASLREVRETPARFLPVKASRINDYTANRRPVATEPLCRRVDDNIGAERHNWAPEAPCSKGVVNLENEVGKPQ